MKKKIILGLTALWIIVAVFATIESVTSSAEVSALRMKELKLIDFKGELEATFIKSISSSDLELKSTELGFVKSENLLFIGGGGQVASKN